MEENNKGDDKNKNNFFSDKGWASGGEEHDDENRKNCLCEAGHPKRRSWKRLPFDGGIRLGMYH